MERWIVATGNLGKRSELQELFGEVAELVALSEVGLSADLLRDVEDGQTYWQNAYRKAAHVAKHTGAPALADDSGLEVRGLEWGPGVHTARFAGIHADDRENIQLLLERLAGRPETDRRAVFRAVLCLVEPSGRVWYAGGTLFGWIAPEPRGTAGFGYDPVFIPDGAEKTLAELGAVWKRQYSHRAWAAKAMIRLLQAKPRTV